MAIDVQSWLYVLLASYLYLAIYSDTLDTVVICKLDKSKNIREQRLSDNEQVEVIMETEFVHWP